MVIEGFSSATYRDWSVFFEALQRQARPAHWRGPLIIDEFPYLVEQSRELPSILQKFVDAESRTKGILTAIAGSSQRMMHGIALDESAPLYGRAQQILKPAPLGVEWLARAFAFVPAEDLLEFFGLFGGTPKYWELAHAEAPFDLVSLVDTLVLDPLGPLHQEPDRLLLQEIPNAMSLRPILDAVGAGANRISEVAGRIGQAATSLSRPLSRLIEMDLIHRELPYGESEKSSKKSLYKISDPFFRLWFTAVAPFRPLYSQAGPRVRKGLFRKFKNSLISKSWEMTCRNAVVHLSEYDRRIKSTGPFPPAKRYWSGNGPEWDIVSRSIDGETVLLGEAKWGGKQCSGRDILRYSSHLLSKGVPEPLKGSETVVYALFVHKKPTSWKDDGPVIVYDAEDILSMASAE